MKNPKTKKAIENKFKKGFEFIFNYLTFLVTTILFFLWAIVGTIFYFRSFFLKNIYFTILLALFIPLLINFFMEYFSEKKTKLINESIRNNLYKKSFKNTPSKEFQRYKEIIENLENINKIGNKKSKKNMYFILILMLIVNFFFALFAPDNNNFIPLIVFVDGALIATVYKIYDTQFTISKTFFDKKTLYLEKLISLSNTSTEPFSTDEQYISEKINNIGK
ncbi:hypothetical protein [Leuconostoc gasicomitatum]|uniref:hypothetical protein n=1 Tax=Leuconostoc gasicomitatum TaxID=115778 RepID=UPI0007E18412|nr:hypothetical protein [Leuconostoc gasicomitatum]CUW09249.1 hypothetical protein PB1E_1047 [Leuconostoc gasicomitatum]